MKGYEAPTPVNTPVKKKGAKGKQPAEDEDEDNSQDPDRDTGEKHAIEDERALIAETGTSLRENVQATESGCEEKFPFRRLAGVSDPPTRYL